jgi:hypothetical protein
MKFHLIALAFGAASACSKEEYREKFGVTPTYELLPTPPPRVEGANVIASVAYETNCPKIGGSHFTAVTKESPEEMSFDIVFLSRGKPACATPSPFPTTFTGEISVPLPSFSNFGLVTRPLMIAFPPEGAFEIYKLSDGKKVVADAAATLEQGVNSTEKPLQYEIDSAGVGSRNFMDVSTN